ncbi:Gfo/Idh/MocA family oxidoreductase, partial [Candidatus Poribacteria bacterium]|nr:Gfo/Idh/MocA family oxidoreductase [Candidatus Poribacteria bacterium]
MVKTYRTGIIGCGGMGRAHSTAYTKNPTTELVAAMDVNVESAKRLADEFSVPTVYTDYNQMLEKEALDIVSIT